MFSWLEVSCAECSELAVSTAAPTAATVTFSLISPIFIETPPSDSDWFALTIMEVCWKV
jgi:hypothetical protein